jgi:AraC family transcriptional activator FtrA
MRKKTDVVWKGHVRQNQAMTTRRHRVVCVLADGMTSIGPAIANDLFGAPWDLGVPWYSYRVCTADPVPIRVGALRVQVEHGVSALSRADTVIIPGRGLRPPPPNCWPPSAAPTSGARGWCRSAPAPTC